MVVCTPTYPNYLHILRSNNWISLGTFQALAVILHLSSLTSHTENGHSDFLRLYQCLLSTADQKYTGWGTKGWDQQGWKVSCKQMLNHSVHYTLDLPTILSRINVADWMTNWKRNTLNTKVTQNQIAQKKRHTEPTSIHEANINPLGCVFPRPTNTWRSLSTPTSCSQSPSHLRQR